MTAEKAGRTDSTALDEAGDTREVVVFHDINPQAFAFLPYLKSLLGEELLGVQDGSEMQPVATAQLMDAIRQAPPGCRVVHAPHALPVTQKYGEIAARSVVGVTHPLLSLLHRAERAAGRDSVAGFLAGSPPQYPVVNFQTSFLLGGRKNVGRGVVVELATALVNRIQVGLADFPDAMQAMTVGELLRAGAPLAGHCALSFGAGTTLVRSLRTWREALPQALFERLCRLSDADLDFFDVVAAHLCKRSALSRATCDEIAAVVEEAATITGHRVGGMSAVTRRASAKPQESPLYETDPVLGYRLRPGGTMDVTEAGQRVVMQADHSGCRPVPGQPATGERTFAAYGCSFVYGWMAPVEATFCALLQAMRPTWRVENHGIVGFGDIHNLLQLTRDLRFSKLDFVTFGWVGNHLVRNVAEVTWVQQCNRSAEASQRSPRKVTPRAYLSETGKLMHREITLWRPDLADLDLTAFRTDRYYMEEVCFAIIERAASLVRAGGGHFLLTTMSAPFPARVAANLARAGIPVLDLHVDGPENCVADGVHPNAQGHRVYAERLHQYFARHLGEA